MAVPPSLPLPCLTDRAGASVPALSDDALASSVGVRLAFTGRAGGAGTGAFESLNLGGHVGDDPAVVARNRAAVLRSLGVPDAPLIVPNQVHGTDFVDVADGSDAALSAARAQAAAGADGIMVDVPGVAALLCFADCVPVIVVSPTGRFAVVHAGWRGAVAGITGAAVGRISLADARSTGTSPEQAAAELNVYVGPHICARCFEVGGEVSRQFADRIGPACVPDAAHVDLSAAVRADAESAGVRRGRIVCADACTACSPDRYFSYRASGGVCGRQGAVAIRMEG